MKYMNVNCLIGQSGGPTSAINTSLAGVILEAKKSKHIQRIFGALNGIDSLVQRNIIELTDLLNNPRDSILLCQTPSAILGSCRYKLPSCEDHEDLFEKIFAIFREYNILYFFYIGGNDSMDTIYKLSQYAKKINSPVRIIGIPKTIDNDLIGTDHTPGYGSAAKFIATTVREIACDSAVYDLQSVTIIEIMGRNAGWLTAASALARTEKGDAPDFIYLPEVPFSKTRLLEDIESVMLKKKNIMIAISEGIQDENGNYISATDHDGKIDGFGHKILGGTAKHLAQVIKNTFGCKVRAIELNVLQRCAAHMISKTDIFEAKKIGREAVKAAIKGMSGKMMAFERKSSTPYEIDITSIDIQEIANLEKKIPREWINMRGNDVTEQLISYMTPFIQGELKIIMNNGIPEHLRL